MAENVAAVGAGAVFRRIPLVGPIGAPIAAQVKEKCPAPYLNCIERTLISLFFENLLFGAKNTCVLHDCMAGRQGKSRKNSPAPCKPVA